MASSKSNPSPAPSIASFYQRQIGEYQVQLDKIERHSVWVSRLRILTFFPAVGLAIGGWVSSHQAWPWYVGAGILFGAFIGLAAFHENVLRRQTELKHRRGMNRIQQARLQRRWEDIPAFAPNVPGEHRAVSTDLDLFGPSSLFQLLSLAHTPFGSEALRDWLLDPAESDEIKTRQQAVSVLAPNVSFREELDLRGRLLGASEHGPRDFVQWAEGPAWLTARPWLKWLTRILTVGALMMPILGFTGWTNAGVAWLVFVIIIAANFVVNMLFAGRVYEIFNSVSSRNHEIQHYRPLLRAIAELPPDCAFVRRLRSNMGRSPQEPIQILNRLMRIIRFANLRRDGLLGIPYYFSQLIFLTDFHVLYFMEVWQQRHGHVVRRWLESVGQLEAISSLACLAHDHPDWTLPVVREPNEKTIIAQALGHPLLAEDVCVRNDVEVGPGGTFLLVTGSNMSGKSTLLRALGVNVALAQAGGPVCAAEFQLPPVHLATSMRIHDSLAEGVSFFMAELKRLKQIVDQSRDLQDSTQWTVLYLLDEILQGTNSAERHIAVSRVIRHLVEHGSIGVVSTHDLGLASSPEISGACQTVHFREQLVGEGARREMTFDYKMRDGLSPTTNALKLLEIVGLVEPDQ